MPRNVHRWIAVAAILVVGLAPLAARGQAAPPAVRDTTRPRARPALDSMQRMDTLRVTAPAAPRTVSYLGERNGVIVYTGKKTEVVFVDSMGANAAQNVARQVLGRVPGLVVSETEGTGFPANGIAIRGLDPLLSTELNVRQNGIGIAADPFGYPEAYYLPPLEAVERVEIVRGAAALQFGPQMGGMVNYVMRRPRASGGSDVTLQQTAGANGLTVSFGSIAGRLGRLSWLGAAERKAQDGWRPNSDLSQVTSYLSASMPIGPQLTLALEYSGLRNRLKMPGGLTDAQFETNPSQSTRGRNWLASPWNVGAATLTWTPSPGTRVEAVTSVLSSGRDIVWRDEAGGPAAVDARDPVTGQFVNREVARLAFRHIAEEVRLRSDVELFGVPATLAAGARWYEGTMRRQSGGEGSTGNDFSLALEPGTAFEKDVRLSTRNVAAWFEYAMRLTGRLTIAPGLRVEHLRTGVGGYTDTTYAPQTKERTVALAGLGATYLTGLSTALYANAAQAYRPIDYAFLTPVGSVSRIDPAMKDPAGTSMDFGWRGSLWDERVRFDLNAFRLEYRDRVGLRSRTDASGRTFTERTNVANSTHQGVESYVEMTPIARAGDGGTITVFNSLAFTDAKYTSGDVRGRWVQYAPRVVERVGVTLVRGPVSVTAIGSSTSKAYGDADNTERSDDSIVGAIPAYEVLDVATTIRITPRWRLQAGVNNLADRRYFTHRVDEYPGPGILPSPGRSLYVTLRAQP